MKIWTKALCAALCVCLLLTGCASGKPQSDPGPDGAPSPSPAQSDAPTDYSKYNAYVDLSDELFGIEEVLNVYFANVAYQPEFELLVGGDYANIKDAVQFYTGMSYAVREALDYADDAPAYPEADAAVLALGDSVEKLMDALDHLGSYMRFDDYVDDDMARAPELHAELWAALETYSVYAPAFMDALAALDRQTEEESLAQLKDSGQTILYQSQMYMNAAQGVQEEIWAQIAASLDDEPEVEGFVLPAIDMTALAPVVEEMDAAYQALAAALADETEVAKVFDGKQADSAKKLYANKVDGLYVKAGALVQALQSGEDYGEALDAMDEAVSDMINAYNNII